MGDMRKVRTWISANHADGSQHDTGKGQCPSTQMQHIERETPCPRTSYFDAGRCAVTLFYKMDKLSTCLSSMSTSEPVHTDPPVHMECPPCMGRESESNISEPMAVTTRSVVRTTPCLEHVSPGMVGNNGRYAEGSNLDLGQSR